ncbi:hypothetical protein FRB94_001958 [Tulasnella sp. JGI-2019a]|nr:hypothetical protein FRB94_001958 [Tulasnella sp. JGI-2019a]
MQFAALRRLVFMSTFAINADDMMLEQIRSSLPELRELRLWGTPIAYTSCLHSHDDLRSALLLDVSPLSGAMIDFHSRAEKIAYLNSNILSSVTLGLELRTLDFLPPVAPDVISKGKIDQFIGGVITAQQTQLLEPISLLTGGTPPCAKACWLMGLETFHI